MAERMKMGRIRKTRNLVVLRRDVRGRVKKGMGMKGKHMEL